MFGRQAAQQSPQDERKTERRATARVAAFAALVLLVVGLTAGMATSAPSGLVDCGGSSSEACPPPPPPPDTDGDGVSDSQDNCPTVSNRDQADFDRGGRGDACDGDDDQDGVADAPDDCEQTPRGTRVAADGCPDADGDGTADRSDAFDDDPAEQVDLDGDGIGDNADPDDDGDGAPDTSDAFPRDRTEQADCDGDRLGDNADTDDGQNCATPAGTETQTQTTETPATTQQQPTPPAEGATQGETTRSREAPRLFKGFATRLVRRPGGLRLDSGLVARCPVGGPACAVRVSIKTQRGGRSIFLTRSSRFLVVRPGTERRVPRLLTSRAARLLRDDRSLLVTVRGVTRTTGGAPIVRSLQLRLRRPRTG